MLCAIPCLLYAAVMRIPNFGEEFIYPECHAAAIRIPGTKNAARCNKHGLRGGLVLREGARRCNEFQDTARI